MEIVCLTQGNHDIEMDASLAGFTFGDHVTFMKDTISLDGVVMHHGHQWDLFNRPDPRGFLLPLSFLFLTHLKDVICQFIMYVAREGSARP